MHAGPGADDVLESERLAVFDELVELRLQLRLAVMRTDALEPGLVERVAEIRRSLVEISGGFNFCVSRGGRVA